ncbi:hypothetical protein DYB25_003033 [Aphanomyces astaci]|uniref:FYVE-type domain-containing protein n=1 Tax=Aphanomyces astaci TaxID=112090 RepID=A0A397EEZ1_APHAT|nr:hypothetical protein DYB25_003033 [Aphanomyces astaci]RHY23470.1 hypothetical protein DYB36_012224 [Aphanomyces astaci]RHY53970.1 hypothetical protein DYB34_014156 [Aphanomyces astaci]RHY77785.1 hypothetical protein DYB30_014214 [Aphanomyces astaci]RHY78000.1 hypothetical protein DYB38_008978 [Aphanomyces astaci]
MAGQAMATPRRPPATSRSSKLPKALVTPGFHRSVTQDADELMQLGVDTIDKFLARESGHDGSVWTPQTSSPRRDSTVSFSTGKVPGYSVRAVKATGQVACSAVHLANKLKDPVRLREYDMTILSSRVVEEVDMPSFTTIQFWQGVPLFPATAREFCVLTAERRLPQGVIVLAARSIEHPAVPPNAAYVRGEIYITGFILRPTSASTCTVTALRHVNLHGAAAPLVRRKAEDMAAVVQHLQRLYGTSGHVPDTTLVVAAPLRDKHDVAAPESSTHTSICTTCSKDVEHGYSRHRCVVCHRIFCGDCARHAVKTKQWQVLRMCNLCASESRENCATDERDCRATTAKPVEDHEAVTSLSRNISPATVLVVGAAATLVIWMEWRGQIFALVVVLTMCVMLSHPNVIATRQHIHVKHL